MDCGGTFQNVRMILDSGSQYSFITASCARRLGFSLGTYQGNLSISGIGQVAVSETQGVLNCCLRSLTNPTTYHTKVVVLDHITSSLPQTNIPVVFREKYSKFALADSQFWKTGPIDFLLGADLFYDVLSGKPIFVAPNIPKVTPTVFGYVIGGRFQKPDHQHKTVSLFVQNDELTDILKRFWAVEEVAEKKLMSPADTFCEEHFQKTHYRTPEGRYVVSLPFNKPPPDLSKSHYLAAKRFHNLEQKLSRNPQLNSAYSEFMQEYLNLDHMSPSTVEAAYTIPHHAVFKSNENNPKLRVVFDASCSTSLGSLNDCLHAGPTLQNDIGEIILRFRRHAVVFTTDIVKMFRQVLLDPKDRKFQHVLWRFNPNDELCNYQLNTVTYGTKPAPYLAIRTLHQLVKDDGHLFPLASTALMQDSYVDDIATGSDTLEGAMKLKEELIQLLKGGCFELSKWSSNCPKLLQNESNSQLPLNLSPKDEVIKILGLQWDPARDVFTYKIDAPQPLTTKRSILSSIARIFDPLGYLSPVVCFAKVILQACWREKVDWDEIVPPFIADDWSRFVKELPLLSQVAIPRLINSNNAVQLCVIGFCDASQLAYSASIYLRIKDQTEKVQVHLLKAKTKLAPLKPLTIPRLELSAALLLCRLWKSLKGFLDELRVSHQFWFSDSTVVLGWLATTTRQHSRRLWLTEWLK